MSISSSTHSSSATGSSRRLRRDQLIISSVVPTGSRVLDLGCGDGLLLRHLMDERDCLGTGVDADTTELITAAGMGVPVLELDLDADLGEFHDDSYDVVVLSRTLQAVPRPGEVIRQMARIGRLLIVSMPNFGYWRNRLRLVCGHMPVSRDLPFQWHDTPNVRYSTVIDLEAWFADEGLDILQRVSLGEHGRPTRAARTAPNLLAGSTIHVLRSNWTPVQQSS
ncbi:methionine biosynthesis protein MetW [Acidipropionibacterium jensenii]|uniref:Methionine biosynthesis protein MetW n=1 Tax=Acidipropionibacterium jensenii TaxID=1749 RepID=A0A3S4VHF7_9ACTN|nr:methionine biosynthesis protein MetW [Acidipropionibacterium jensenii]MDN5976251.1 methionine biosynthesis protein MetW [Acidipropionibacterium jensenii]MDN5996138.1 methionine biosynthesis protein MetW [Acidipropionibacterium jensenii]MDN6020770.1 methionine biosynthesis protein MetW [Acidipropionibacterium jensenii]MDN6427302.1 methionine biosynthesis protein MetW [Acidipropionibacterium jensenii]MDN6441889.1 methionine biosynthesis protein MetW [Acidipropionibacterium jensenii]